MHEYNYKGFLALSLILALSVYLYFIKREKLDLSIGIGLFITCLAFGIFVAKLFFYFGPWTWGTNLSAWQRIVGATNFYSGGLVFYGGILGACLGFKFFIRTFEVSWQPYPDLLGLTLPFIAGVSRLGCWFSGCCGGINTKLPWAIVRDGQTVHPVQLYNVGIACILAIVIIFIHTRKPYHGYTAICSILMYSATRFVTEFFRLDPKYLELTINQWLSIVIVVVCVFLFYRLGNVVKHNNYHAA